MGGHLVFSERAVGCRRRSNDLKHVHEAAEPYQAKIKTKNCHQQMQWGSGAWNADVGEIPARMMVSQCSSRVFVLCLVPYTTCRTLVVCMHVQASILFASAVGLLYICFLLLVVLACVCMRTLPSIVDADAVSAGRVPTVVGPEWPWQKLLDEDSIWPNPLQ